MSVQGATILGLNPTQTEILFRILENPYKVFAVDGDVKKSTARATNLLINTDDSIDIFSALDVEKAIKALKKSLSNRGHLLGREASLASQSARCEWAKEVCAQNKSLRYADLRRLCIQVWGTRLPDRYKKEITSLFCSSTPTLPKSAPPTLPKSAPKKENQSAVDRVKFTLGGVDFVLTKGASLSIKSITSDTGAVLSDIVVQS